VEQEELKYYFNKIKFGEDHYHELMKKRVREVLLISTLYDAFIFEQDGRLSEKIYGEYKQLNLSTAPRITSVPTAEHALAKLSEKKYDLVITMVRVGSLDAFELSAIIKKIHPGIPILLLLNIQADIALVERNRHRMDDIDDVFIWNGDAKLFLAMVKSVEDKLNIDKDTLKGFVRVILLVEDSILYYSVFLPLLYKAIMEQTQLLIKEELDDTNKRLRMRARPKVLLAHNYNDAIQMYEKYKNEILIVISDVRYPRDGVMDGDAGYDLLKSIRADGNQIPAVLQSSEPHNEKRAAHVNARFLLKGSSTILLDMERILKEDLGLIKIYYSPFCALLPGVIEHLYQVLTQCISIRYIIY